MVNTVSRLLNCCYQLVALLLASALLDAPVVVGIQIAALRVPAAVRNASGSPAILDCEFTLRPDELNSDSGLVVKWFFNNGPAPVYQWIPGQKPQELGILKGRLNVSHRASDNHATMHRALYIVNPTTELSGDYKCFVSTFGDEDFMTKRMVVYATERNLELTQVKADIDSVNISCRAQGVYPEPKMALYKDRDRTNGLILKGVVVESTSKGGEYDIIAYKVIKDEDLQSPTEFDCELRIPEANYVVRKSIVYYTGDFDQLTDSGSRGILTVHQPLVAWIFTSLLLIICCPAC